WEVLSVGTDGSIGADGAGWDGRGGRAGRGQAAGVRAGSGRFGAAAFCGGNRKNQAAPQVPAMIAAKETQPWQLDRLRSTRDLPLVQPAASAAPTPVATPPPALRRMVVTSGTRQRNSPVSFAATKEPSRMPSTSITDQSTRVTSPVDRKVTILADGVVMPRPPLRPAAGDSTQARIAGIPSSTPPTQGLQGMSAR